MFVIYFQHASIDDVPDDDPEHDHVAMADFARLAMAGSR
jgi:hypothetical protein